MRRGFSDLASNTSAAGLATLLASLLARLLLATLLLLVRFLLAALLLLAGLPLTTLLLLARFLLTALLLLAGFLLTALLLARLRVWILIHNFLSNIVSNARSIAHEKGKCVAGVFVPPHAFKLKH